MIEQPEVVPGKRERRDSAPRHPADRLAGRDDGTGARVLEPDVLRDGFGDDPRWAPPAAPRSAASMASLSNGIIRNGIRMTDSLSGISPVSRHLSRSSASAFQPWAMISRWSCLTQKVGQLVLSESGSIPINCRSMADSLAVPATPDDTTIPREMYTINTATDTRTGGTASLGAERWGTSITRRRAPRSSRPRPVGRSRRDAPPTRCSPSRAGCTSGSPPRPSPGRPGAAPCGEDAGRRRVNRADLEGRAVVTS